MQGIVIKNTGSWYTVRTDEGKNVDCKIRATSASRAYAAPIRWLWATVWR